MAGDKENDNESSLEAELKRIARNASRHSVGETTRIENLEYRLDKLNIIVDTLWQIVAEKTSMSEDELLRRIEELIAQRSQKESKTLACRSCNRLVASNNGLCMYCGSKLLGPDPVSPFDTPAL